MKQKIVVLGSSGFLGSEVYKKFLEDPTSETYGFSSSDINLLNKTDCKKLLEIFDENTSVIMLAGILRRKNYTSRTMLDNIEMAANLMDEVSKSKVSHIVYTSSISVYGKTNIEPINEYSKQDPNNLYALAKSCSENLLKICCNELKIPLTILHPGTIYGKGDERSPIFKFVENAKSGKNIEIYGNGAHKLYCIHKKDLSNIIIDIVKNLKTGEFNTVVDDGISLINLANLVKKYFENVKIELKESKEDPVLLSFDSYNFKSFFDLKFIPFEEGILEYIFHHDFD